MKFLVISDTHGDISKAAEIYRDLNGIDAVIHLGDMQKDAEALAELLGTDVISVRGNMDNGYRKEDAFRTLDTEYGRMLLTHGHMQNVKSSLTSLMYLAEEQGCMAALFGHTHIPIAENINGLWVINPGSLTYPAAGSKPSYALVTTEPDGFRVGLRSYKPKADAASAAKDAIGSENARAGANGGKQKPNVQGGFIRNILNNSDRL